MKSSEKPFYLTSAQTEASAEIQALAKAIKFNPSNLHLISASLTQLHTLLIKCRYEDILNFASCNPTVGERLDYLTQERMNLGLRSMYVQASKVTQRGLAHYTFNAVRSAQEIVRDGLRVTSKFHCTDASTLLLSLLRLHQVPCRLCWYIYREPGGRLSLSSAVEALVEGKPHFIHQGRHGIITNPGLVEDYHNLTPPLICVLRTPDAHNGYDFSALSLLMDLEEHKKEFDLPLEKIATMYDYENGESRLFDFDY